MENRSVQFVPRHQARGSQQAVWPTVRVSAETIAQEIERLADCPPAEDGLRAATLVHPCAREPGLGFAPGVEVTINVLKPGETTRAVRSNANQLEFCIRGTGLITLGADSLALNKWDVCTLPSMRSHTHRNTGNELWVRLSYSNAPLLEKLGAYYLEQAEADTRPEHPNAERLTADARQKYTRVSAPDIAIGQQGARLRGYEFLTDIAVVPNPPLHWPWQEVSQHLSRRPGDDKRTIMLLYNPATERRNGTTHTFFATISSRPAGAPARPAGRGHRHSSVAINYHFEGAGYSVVDGQTIEWRAGDLLLSAPSWAEHAHFLHNQGSATLTVQDHPLHIGMESLIWQERMDGPILTLGSEDGQTGYVGPRLAGG